MSQNTLEDLINQFLKQGGKINSYYLQNSLRSKQTLVYLNGWFSGKNIRDAITKAFAAQ